MPSMLQHEQAAWSAGSLRVAGVDEAGRGPLAGPVTAAAVVFSCPDVAQELMDSCLQGLTDSKQLSEKRREHFFAILQSLPAEQVTLGVGQAEPEEIDRINILRATHEAMRRAIGQLRPAADFILVDGLAVPDLPHPSRNLIKGDALSLSIAAASVLAKVTRDRQMQKLAQAYPHYGFERHKGYGTKVHLAALREHGPCPAHRWSFKPVRQLELFRR